MSIDDKRSTSKNPLFKGEVGTDGLVGRYTDKSHQGTPRTDAHLAHLNLPDGRKVGLPDETVEFLRQLEREVVDLSMRVMRKAEHAAEWQVRAEQAERQLSSALPTKQVPEGEPMWLIETSTLAVKSDPTYPQRHFWTGSGWHFDALQAARYKDKAAAELVREKYEMYPLDKYPVCGHLFQCGVSATRRSERCKTQGHVWVGVGDDGRVVCDDCGIDKHAPINPAYPSFKAMERDALDAARYRWLRGQKHADIAACWLVPTDVETAEELDAAIDAELSRQYVQHESRDG